MKGLELVFFGGERSTSDMYVCTCWAFRVKTLRLRTLDGSESLGSDLALINCSPVKC